MTSLLKSSYSWVDPALESLCRHPVQSFLRTLSGKDEQKGFCEQLIIGIASLVPSFHPSIIYGAFAPLYMLELSKLKILCPIH